MKKSERATIATRLKEAREYLGLSQQEVADAIKISRSAISLIESGQRGVESVELNALARLYHRPIGYFTGEDPQALGGDVAMLAKQVASLSEQDRTELLRFSEYLVQRAQARTKDGNSA
jgi:transcriptional regulator with XRE-family HTH domain